MACFNQDIAGLLLTQNWDFKPYAVEERKDKQGNWIALIHMRLPRKEKPEAGSGFDPAAGS